MNWQLKPDDQALVIGAVLMIVYVLAVTYTLS